jgi:hypothetical protein
MFHSRSTTTNRQTLDEFDHTFKGELHTTHGKLFTDKFGLTEFCSGREIIIVCKKAGFEIVEELGITSRRTVDVRYLEV